MIDRERLRGMAGEIGILPDDGMLARLDAYAERLVEVNKFHNLTAIIAPKEIEIKHFLDSMTAVRFIPTGGRVVDVGSGAGFPGVVLGIVRPGINLTLVDASRKRVDFLRELCDELGVQADCIHARAEDLARGESRETFDLAVSRAVADMPALLEYCLPLVRVGGLFVAMKGRNGAEEAAGASGAARLLGAGEAEVTSLVLPDGSERTLCAFEKLAATAEKYPRRGKKIGSCFTRNISK